MKKTGWIIHETSSWTRKGAGKQKDTNIDVVVTRGISEESMQLVQKEHDPNVSDHKPL